MQRLFLPLGFILAFILAGLLPEWGRALSDAGVMPWLVVTVFLVNGYQVRLAEVPRAWGFLKVVLVSAAVSLLLGPWLGSLLAQELLLSAGALIGLVVIGSVPPTLSSCIVLTQAAGGYAVWALVLSLVLNIVGVLSMPFMLAWLLNGYDTVGINPWLLLSQLGFIVLLPFLLGILLQRYLRPIRASWLLQYLPSGCILIGVWMAMSDSVDIFNNISLLPLLQISLAVLLLHLLLFVANWWGGKLLCIERQGRIAMTLTGSQKTLPVAMSVLALMDGPVGEALLVCVLFHFLTLFIDTLIAPWMGKRQLAANT